MKTWPECISLWSHSIDLLTGTCLEKCTSLTGFLKYLLWKFRKSTMLNFIFSKSPSLKPSVVPTFITTDFVFKHFLNSSSKQVHRGEAYFIIWDIWPVISKSGINLIKHFKNEYITLDGSTLLIFASRLPEAALQRSSYK